MISDLFNDMSFIDVLDIQNLLLTEKMIAFKKKNNIKLTSQELFFDTYFVKPSFMLGIIEKRCRRKKHGKNC